jgi:hypothetical protein
MLQDVIECGNKLLMKGVGGAQFMVVQQGHLTSFISVHASKQAKANALSFAKV